MDTVLKESTITKKAKTIILGITIVAVFLGAIFLIVNSSLYNADSNKYIYNDYLGNVGYLPGLLDESGFYLRYYVDFWAFPYVYIGLYFWGVAVCFLFTFFMMRKMQITVTDKRVCGKTYFGRSVDLPMDSISAVGSSWFNGIKVSTSSGKVSFLHIEKSKEIRELLCQLLIERQEKLQSDIPAKSNADELKKYKELLDGGIITQEEFDTKKKQLLGL